MAEDEAIDVLSIDAHGEIAARLSPVSTTAPVSLPGHRPKIPPCLAKSRLHATAKYAPVGLRCEHLLPFIPLLPVNLEKLDSDEQKRLYEILYETGVRAYLHLMRYAMAFADTSPEQTASMINACGGSAKAPVSDEATPNECNRLALQFINTCLRTANASSFSPSSNLADTMDQALETLQGCIQHPSSGGVISIQPKSVTVEMAASALRAFVTAAMRRSVTRNVESYMSAASEPSSGQLVGGSDSDTASGVIDDPVMHFDRTTRFRCDEDETRTVREDGLLGLAVAVGYEDVADMMIRIRGSAEYSSNIDSTPLHEAACVGTVNVIRQLIKCGADVNALSATNNTALIYAAAAGQTEVVKELLAHPNIDLTVRNENGHDALCEAASCGHIAIAKMLVEAGAKPTFLNMSSEFKQHESPLTLAAYKGHTEMVEYLLTLGPSIAEEKRAATGDDTESSDSTPTDGSEPTPREEELYAALLEASMDGYVEVANLLLKAGAPVSLNTESYESPLTLACCGGHYELVKLLLDWGAYIEEPNDESYTALMEGAREGHLQVVKVLLERGANVNAQTEDTGETAMTLAACGGFTDVLEALVEAGGNLELGSNAPLLEASQEGHLATVNYILEYSEKNKDKFNVDTFAAHRDSSFLLACDNGHLDVLEKLYESGADVDVELDGRTALMRAAKQGYTEIVRYLIQKGADVNYRSSNQDATALLLACSEGFKEIVEMLLNAGADPTIELKDGVTCVLEASRFGHHDILAMLFDYNGSQTAAVNAAREAKKSKEQKEETVSQSGQTGLAGLSAMSTKILAAKIEKTAAARRKKSSHSGSVSSTSPMITPPSSTSSSIKNISSSAANAAFDEIVSKMNYHYATTGKHYTEQSVFQALATILQKNHGHGTSLPIPTGNVSGESKKQHINDVDLSEYNRVCEAFEKTRYDMILKSIKATSAELKKQTSYTEDVELDALIHMDSIIREMLAHAGHGYPYDYSYAAICLVIPPKRGSLYPSLAPVPPSKDFKEAAKGGKTSKRLHNWAECVRKCWLAMHHQLISQPNTTGVDSSVHQHWQQQLHQTPADCEFRYGPHVISAPLDMLPLSEDAIKQAVAPLIQNTDASTRRNMLNALCEHESGGSARARPLLPSICNKDVGVTYRECVTSTDGTTKRSFSSSKDFSYHTQLQFHLSSAVTAGTSHFSYPATAALARLALSKLKKNNTIKQRELAILTAYSAAHQTPSGHNAEDIKASKKMLDDLTANMHADQRALLLEKMAKLASCDMNNCPDRKLHEMYLDLCDEQARESLDATYNLNAANALSMLAEAHGKAAGNCPHDSPFCCGAHTPADLAQLYANLTSSRDSSTSGPLRRTQSEGDDKSRQIGINKATESSQETPLSVACTNGHLETVQKLIGAGASIEHKDKKGFTPLILAASGGHVAVVDALLKAGAQLEAQSERTKDTALSLACSGGRKDVVELLLKAGANKEHRNVSDYTPLSLAASGGYVDIILMLLGAGAEINSRTGSKLGISPLMLSSMNGHKEATRVLLEHGSDINAQIETNRNTALTLACFQGRAEVVRLLLSYGANVEHRAKTGLTPLHESANGGFYEVGELLLNAGADPNASPVPSSKDTALTIAADKGHTRFINLLVKHGANIDARNKKGCTALWLACHGGHLETVKALVESNADTEALDNRKVSPLTIAFKRGNISVVKHMVENVKQFPSDQDLDRYIMTIADKSSELRQSCDDCKQLIIQAKTAQAEEANKAAADLLAMLDKEEEELRSKREAKLRKKQKAKEKKAAAGKKAEGVEAAIQAVKEEEIEAQSVQAVTVDEKKEEVRAKSNKKETAAEKQKKEVFELASEDEAEKFSLKKLSQGEEEKQLEDRVPTVMEYEKSPPPTATLSVSTHDESLSANGRQRRGKTAVVGNRRRETQKKETGNGGGEQADKLHLYLPSGHSRGATGPHSVGSTRSSALSPQSDDWQKAHKKKGTTKKAAPQSQSSFDKATAGGKELDENGWKDTDATRRKAMTCLFVGSSAIARVIGRSGTNINAIREATGASIEVEKLSAARKEPHERQITIKGTADCVRNATHMINALVADSETPITDIIRNVLRSNSSSVEPRCTSQPSAEAISPSALISHKHKDGAELYSGKMTASVNANAAASATSGDKSTKSGGAQQGSATTTTNVWEQRLARQKEKERERQEAMRAGSDRSTSSPRTVSEPSANEEPMPVKPTPTAFQQPQAELTPNTTPSLPKPIGPPNKDKEKSQDEEIQPIKKANKPEPLEVSPTVPPPVLPEVTPNTSLPYTPLSAPLPPSQAVTRNISTDSVLTPTGHDLTNIHFLDESTHAKLAEIWGPGTEQSAEPAWGGQLMLNKFSSLSIAGSNSDWVTNSPSADFLGLLSSSPPKPNPSTGNSMHSATAEWSSSLGSSNANTMSSSAEHQKPVGYGRSSQQPPQRQPAAAGLRTASQSIPLMQSGVHMGQSNYGQQSSHGSNQDNNVFNQLAAQLLTAANSSVPISTTPTSAMPSAASSYYPSPSYTDPSILGMGTLPSAQPVISSAHHHAINQASHPTIKNYMANYHQEMNDFESLNSILSYGGNQSSGHQQNGEFYPPHSAHTTGHRILSTTVMPPPGFGDPQPNTSIPPPALRSQFYPPSQMMQAQSQQLPQPPASSAAYSAYSSNGSSSWMNQQQQQQKTTNGGVPPQWGAGWN